MDVDGRHLRRKQNRETVLDALVDLWCEGNYQPSSNEIAERAGLSPRSLFRYFDDVDDLNRAAIERQLEGARPMLAVDIPVDAPLEERIDQLVRARVRMYETIEPAARAARVCAHRHPIVADQLHESRSYLRHQIAKLFPEAGDLAVAAADALCAFEAYDLLRSDQRLSRQKTISALTAALHALLAPTGADA